MKWILTRFTRVTARNSCTFLLVLNEPPEKASHNTTSFSKGGLCPGNLGIPSSDYLGTDFTVIVSNDRPDMQRVCRIVTRDVVSFSNEMVWQ